MYWTVKTQPVICPKISLHDGRSVIVDQEFYDVLNQFKWRSDDSRGPTTQFKCEHTDNRFTTINMKHMVMVLRERAGDLICLCDSSYQLCGLEIKYVNGDRYDCRMENIEYAKIESYRRPGIKSKYRGVTRYQKKWMVKCWMNGKLHHLGMFTDEAEAAKAFDDFCILNGLKNRKLNFPRINQVQNDYDFLKQMLSLP